MDSELRKDLEEKETDQPRAGRAARTGILVVLVGIFITLSFFFYNFQFVIVSGESMLPTLTSNQRILVCKALWALGQPAHGDIVVLDTENGFIVKRVAYLPGEEVPSSVRPFEWPVDPNFVVPAGFVYVLGDNIQASEDSRTFGPVRIDHIVGKAVLAK
jgi:signal peptidase I